MTTAHIHSVGPSSMFPEKTEHTYMQIIAYNCSYLSKRLIYGACLCLPYSELRTEKQQTLLKNIIRQKKKGNKKTLAVTWQKIVVETYSRLLKPGGKSGERESFFGKLGYSKVSV